MSAPETDLYWRFRIAVFDSMTSLKAARIALENADRFGDLWERRDALSAFERARRRQVRILRAADLLEEVLQ